MVSMMITKQLYQANLVEVSHVFFRRVSWLTCRPRWFKNSERIPWSYFETTALPEDFKTPKQGTKFLPF